MSCEEKSPGAKEILAKINSIVSSGTPAEVDKNIQNLKNLSNTLSAAGGIDDVVAIAELFFSTSTPDVETIQLKDKGKTLGKFKVIDLSDNPELDITELIPPIISLNLTGIDNLKFSISVPTIEIVKTLGFGPLSVKIKFLITKKDFTFLPVLDLGIDTREKALENLKGKTYNKPVNYKTPVDQIKALASSQYSTSKEVMDAVSTSNTSLELIQKLNAIGVIITQEIDIQSEAKQSIAAETAFDNTESYQDDDCGTPDLFVPPFTSAEVKELQKDCCSEEKPADTAAENAASEENAANQISDSTTQPTIDEAAILQDLQNFLGEIDSSNSTMKGCALERQYAYNNYYWFLEASVYNEMALHYAESRAIKIDILNGSFQALEDARIQRLERSRQLKVQENNIIREAYNSIYQTTTNTLLTEDIVLQIGDIQLDSEKLQAIESNKTYAKSLGVVRNEINQNEEAIQQLSSQIEDQKRNFDLPDTSAIQQFILDPFAGSDSSNFLENAVKNFRRNFLKTTNPLTNSVGYDDTLSLFKLEVHPFIFQEAKTLFSLGSPEAGDVSDYVSNYESLLATRERFFATELWNKLYSAKRYNVLFTYQEKGYTSPLPVYDDSGNLLDPTVMVTVNNPIGDPVQQEVAKSVLDIKVDTEIYEQFWPNVEAKTLEKVTIIIGQIKNSEIYQNYMNLIKNAAENEAKLAYAENLIFQENSYNTRFFDAYTNTFTFNQVVANASLVVNLNNDNVATAYKNQYSSTYDSFKNFQNELATKMQSLQNFIIDKTECLADQEKKIQEKSDALAKKFSPGSSANATQKDYCEEKLGSDPLGLKPTSDCPGISKNCYWKEYTKLMQSVSAMPIPDVEALTKRLFRYYPVGVQIPCPVPPLPTLASGIPDPLISIPLPIVWKHIVTITSPLGLMVIWIATCGPIPGPYIMFVDEKGDAYFMASPKGPIAIPAKSLRTTEIEDKSLIEYLESLSFKVNISALPFKNLIGNSKIKIDDPDDPSTFLDGIQEKLKNAINTLEAKDPPSFDVTGASAVGASAAAAVKAKKEKLRNALRFFPPDLEAVQQAFTDLETLIDEQVDSLKIKPIKFPKNPKKLMMPPLGPSEFMETLEKVIDAGADLKELGLGVKIISLRKKLKERIDLATTDPEVIAKLAEIDTKIEELETSLSASFELSAEDKVRARAEKIRDSLVALAESVAEKITPEDLGFLAIVTPIGPLPIPCYESITIPPVAGYILAILAAIDSFPALIKNYPIDQLVSLLSKTIDLSYRLPRTDAIVNTVSTTIVELAPDLSFPDVESSSYFKEIIQTALTNFLKIKVRPPRPAGIQITITESMMKEVISACIKAAFVAVSVLVLDELQKSIDENDFAKVLAVAAIIKAVFGTDLSSISGEDIKAFLLASLENLQDFTSTIEDIISAVSIPEIDFKSIKETLFPTFPPKLNPEGPFLEINTLQMLEIAAPLLTALKNVPLPYPLVLLGCAVTASRVPLTKLYPFSAKENLPSWDKMSLKNVPFVIWLDALVATAQKQGGICSDYVAPYYLPDV
jgi:hypothetical protein